MPGQERVPGQEVGRMPGSEAQDTRAPASTGIGRPQLAEPREQAAPQSCPFLQWALSAVPWTPRSTLKAEGLACIS